MNTVEHCDSLQSALEAIQRSGGRATSVVADFACSTAIPRMVAEAIAWAGGIDVLVNNAGVCSFQSVLAKSADDWDRTHAINTRAVFVITQAIADMIARGIRGSFITVGSVGAYAGGSRQAHYNASKAAVQSLMRSMAVELGEFGLRFNSVLPGCVYTRINNAIPATQFEQIAARRFPLHSIVRWRDPTARQIMLNDTESRFSIPEHTPEIP